MAALSEVVRAGLESLVSSAADLELSNDATADVLLVDSAEIEDAEPGPPVVLLTDHPNPPAGVAAVLPGSATRAQILAAIQAVAAGLLVQHPDLVSPTPQRDVRAVSVQPLTEREIQVLGMLSQGLANKNIAWKLGISEHTVKFHVSSIFAKLNVSSRTEAVALGARLGLVLL